ncbi:hypothetical protein ACFX12_021141 [Malus domestica]
MAVSKASSVVALMVVLFAVLSAIGASHESSAPPNLPRRIHLPLIRIHPRRRSGLQICAQGLRSRLLLVWMWLCRAVWDSSRDIIDNIAIYFPINALK